MGQNYSYNCLLGKKVGSPINKLTSKLKKLDKNKIETINKNIKLE